ncbi:MAG: tryptophan-rich sensory protein [Chitinophagales bacterium]|nr:tryptophan-rich sensory protein [Chitinophagales bacterium]
MKRIKGLFITISAILFTALAGNMFVGDALNKWFITLNQPWYSLPLWGWYIVGILYYCIASYILYQTLISIKSKERNKAIILIALMMLGNESWNYLFFGLESAFLGFIGLFPFSFLVAILFLHLQKFKRRLSWVLLPYLFWLVYDFLWTYALWRLNE